MSNVAKLENYLIGENAYLLNNELSSGKVIMLSGEWGSGKTHFWKNKIKDKIDKNVYISLYGKKSINDIENELLVKSLIKKDSDKKRLLENLSLFGNITKNVANTIVPESGEKLEEIKNNLVSRFSKSNLQKGTVICFDDFERKSKYIDLNDLFGFITNLALEFEVTIVVILNDDEFEGENKNIFTNVKEKSVSKYLMYNPSCEELFDLIFNDDKKSYKKDLANQMVTIRNTFIEVGILNARVLIQVLDNVLEWIKIKGTTSDFFLRYFVLTNINFILNHHVFIASLDRRGNLSSILDGVISNREYTNTKKDKDTIFTNISLKTNIDYKTLENYKIYSNNYNSKFIENIKQKIKAQEKENGTKSGKADNSEHLVELVNSNESLVKSLGFMYCFNIYQYGESNSQDEVDILNQINDFIETGIL